LLTLTFVFAYWLAIAVVSHTNLSKNTLGIMESPGFLTSNRVGDVGVDSFNVSVNFVNSQLSSSYCCMSNNFRILYTY